MPYMRIYLNQQNFSKKMVAPNRAFQSAGTGPAAAQDYLDAFLAEHPSTAVGMLAYNPGNEAVGTRLREIYGDQNDERQASVARQAEPVSGALIMLHGNLGMLQQHDVFVDPQVFGDSPEALDRLLLGFAFPLAADYSDGFTLSEDLHVNALTAGQLQGVTVQAVLGVRNFRNYLSQGGQATEYGSLAQRRLLLACHDLANITPKSPFESQVIHSTLRTAYDF